MHIEKHSPTCCHQVLTVLQLHVVCCQICHDVDAGFKSCRHAPSSPASLLSAGMAYAVFCLQGNKMMLVMERMETDLFRAISCDETGVGDSVLYNFRSAPRTQLLGALLLL